MGSAMAVVYSRFENQWWGEEEGKAKDIHELELQAGAAPPLKGFL